jgi:hypothetical protein
MHHAPNHVGFGISPELNVVQDGVYGSPEPYMFQGALHNPLSKMFPRLRVLSLPFRTRDTDTFHTVPKLDFGKKIKSDIYCRLTDKTLDPAVRDTSCFLL